MQLTINPNTNLNKPISIYPATSSTASNSNPEQVQNIRQPVDRYPIPEEPTLNAIPGITYDFNFGFRLKVTQQGCNHRIVFTNTDTCTVVYDSVVTEPCYICGAKKYYAPLKIDVYEKDGTVPVFSRDFNLEGQTVLMQCGCRAVGDTIGWFSFFERFQQKHKCKLIVVMADFLRCLVEKQYPDMVFIDPACTEKYYPYATYYMGLFFKGDTDWQPSDFRFTGNHRTASYILDVSHEDIPPRFDLSAPRQIQEKYCVVACKGSGQAKYWNNPNGWFLVVKFLLENGYRVICIDKDAIHGVGDRFNQLPWGVEDWTGNLPLQERINIIKDADFFIGLSSGLSWVAWGCQVPIVMISGFTHPTNEFYTPYRVINYDVCHSCWNDTKVDFDHFDFMWCPRHKGTPRAFECSFRISAGQVVNTIKKIPQFRPKEEVSE